MYKIWKLYVENYSKLSCQNQNRWQSSVVTLTFDLLIPKAQMILVSFSCNILRLCMKHERCTLKTTQVIVSGPKCWQSSIVTLTFEPLTPKCMGIFLLPSCIYVWNMKAVKWKLIEFIVSEPKCWQSSIVNLTIDLLAPKCIGIFLSPSCIYVWNMKAVRWKLLKLSCQNQSVDGQTDRQTDR